MRYRSVMLLALCVLATGCALGVQPDPIPVFPGQRGADVPGNNRDCATVRHEVTNPAQWQHMTVVLEPAGGADCEAPGRPVIFFGHGYLATFTEGYTQFLDHLVSRGFVVIYPG